MYEFDVAIIATALDLILHIKLCWSFVLVVVGYMGDAVVVQVLEVEHLVDPWYDVEG